MHDNDDIGPNVRNPQSKSRKIIRGKLESLGIWHEVSVDGHEKLGDKALQMGLVGFHIYGARDKWSGKVLLLTVLPSSRFAEAIGHVYLDFCVEYGRASLSLLYYLLMLKLMFYCLTVIPIQVTFDGGSETPDMKGIQTALRYVQLFEVICYL